MQPFFATLSSIPCSWVHVSDRCIEVTVWERTRPKSQWPKIANICFLLTLNVHFTLDMAVFHMVCTWRSGLMKKAPWDNGASSVSAGGKGKTR